MGKVHKRNPCKPLCAAARNDMEINEREMNGGGRGDVENDSKAKSSSFASNFHFASAVRNGRKVLK